jgi:hemoglobin
MKTIAKMALVAGLFVPCIAAAQDSSTKMMMGKPGSLFAKYGIHKIADIVYGCVEAHMADPLLIKNERIAGLKSTTPAPFVKFVVTSWVAHNLGGPQMNGVMGMPNPGQMAKSFMMTRAEAMRFEEMICESCMKGGIPDADAKKIGNLTMEWIAKAKAPTTMPESEPFKDPKGLYARLGGIVPISMVVDEFVNQLGADPVLGANPNVVKSLTTGKISVAGLKFLLTEQLAEAAGGPWKYTGKSMKESHKDLMITDKEWETGGAILKRVLDKFMVPAKEQGEIFAVITSTRKDIVKGG